MNRIEAEAAPSTSDKVLCSSTTPVTGCFGGFSFAKGELSKFKRASQSAGTDSVALLLGDTVGPTSVYERSSKDGTFGRWLSSVGFDVISFSHRDLIFSPLDARAFTRSVTSMALVASNIDPRADPLFNVAASRMVTLPSGLRVLAVSLFSPNKVKEVRDMGPLRIVNEYAALASVVTGALGAADPADLVVLLAKDQIFDDLLQLTLALPRVDVVVSDLDLTFSGNVTLDPVTGVPRTAWVSMPSTSAIGGRAYGMATVKFDAQGRLVPLAAQELARLRGGAGVVKLTSASASDPALTADINVVRDAIIASQSVPIGSTRLFLDGSDFSCRLQECTLGSVLADSVHEWATAALLESRSGPAAKDLAGIAAIVNGGFVRSSISAGNITEVSTRAAFPLVSSNTLLILSGAQLYRTLKWSVNDWAKLNASGSGVGGFLQVSRGLRYSYDPVAQRFASIDVLRPSTGRMEPISHNGTYAVGTLSFLSDGGDGYTWLAPVARLVTEDDSRAIFDRYLKSFSPLSLEAGSRIVIASGKYRSEDLVLRCPAGYAQPADAEFDCRACQAGYYKAGEFRCEPCTGNRWSEAGSDNCTWGGGRKLIITSIERRSFTEIRIGLGLSLLAVTVALMYGVSFIKLSMNLPPPELAISGVARSDFIAWFTMVFEFFQTMSLSLVLGPQNQALFRVLREHFFQFASLPHLQMPTSFWVAAVVAGLIIMASLPLAVIVINVDRQGVIQRRFPNFFRFISRWLEMASLLAPLYIPVSSALFFPVLQLLLRPFACFGAVKDYGEVLEDQDTFQVRTELQATSVDGLICDRGALHSTVLAVSCIAVVLYVVTFSAIESFLQVSNPTRSVTFSPAAMLHITVAKVVSIFASAVFDQPVILLSVQVVSTAFCTGISRTTDSQVRIAVISPESSSQPVSELAGLRYRSLRRQPRRPRVHVFSSSPLASRIRRSVFLSSTVWALAELILYFCIPPKARSEDKKIGYHYLAFPISIAAVGFSLLLFIECMFTALEPSRSVLGGAVPLLCQLAGRVKALLTKTRSKARMMSLVPAPVAVVDVGVQTDTQEDGHLSPASSQKSSAHRTHSNTSTTWGSGDEEGDESHLHELELTL